MTQVTDNDLRLLLVEDNPGDAELFRVALQNANSPGFVITHVEELQQAIAQTATKRFDLMVLDLSLPDSYGLNTVAHVTGQIPDMPVVVLTGLDDEHLGMQAVETGAQDYLIKGQVDNTKLVRKLRFALSRHNRQEHIRAVCMTDELTGLHNRRGFQSLAGQQIKLAKRGGSSLFLLYIDLDGFKGINDVFGHQEGDRALNEAANLLRGVFRSSDVIARFGGDEFVIAVLEADSSCAARLVKRLENALEHHNAQSDRPYELRMSIGVTNLGFADDASIEELIARADSDMYAHKKRRKQEQAGTIT